MPPRHTNMDIKPVNVAGATIMVQLCLLIIIALGIAFQRETEAEFAGRNKFKQRGYLLALTLAILTIIAVALSADYYPIWSPVLGDIRMPTVERGNAFMLVFMLDIFASIILIAWTGGSRSSPFTAILFLIPALAMFLRESPPKFFLYSAIVGLYYVVTCREKPLHRMPMGWETDGAVQSHRIVNVGCLILATVTGYITRPQPV